ncbi:acyl-CoA dehydrogenase family protein [Streptomyces sp. NPDC087298]|uniref:acyl-CoA dehydrogenase family protein n=1 Tax=Streptomyces sp. NPDC087298 TaxID=3365779 RepID=UPI0037FE2154
MRSLELARDLAEQRLPGLVKALAAIPYAEREASGSQVIGLFRDHGGAGLLVPTEYGGLGVDVLEAVRVQRAVGSLSPSLAAATAMHHFTVAMLYALAADPGRLTAAQLKVLHEVAPGRRLMASGWAEGRTQQNILVPAVTATRADGGYLLNGSKKPCSLAGSMDLLTASIAVPGADGTPELALALIPASSPGMSVHPFWANEVLAAAESDEVRLDDVFVPDELVITTSTEDPDRLEDLQSAGFAWFELLASAGYAGAATTLADRVIERGRGSTADRADLALKVESAFALLEGAARTLRDGQQGEAAVATVLVARYAAQESLAQIADRSLELLGGIDFIRSNENARLAAAVRPLAFHPPGRASAQEPLLKWFTGEPLELS